MNRKIKNYIIFGIFLLLLFLSTFISLFGTEFAWPKENNYPTSFGGLIFDDQNNVSGLNVSRGVQEELGKVLVKYDVEFTYTGDPTNVRILGTPVRQIFFPEDVVPSKSNVTLKGEYEKVNQSLFEKLSLKDLYKKNEDYFFTTTSQVRVPLTEEIKDYKFVIYEEPRTLVYQGKKKLADTSVFLTNARMDKFSDEKLPKELAENVTSKIEKDSQSGMYVNSLELVRENKVSRYSLFTNLNSIVFIGSMAVLLILLWLDKKKFKPFYMIAMMLVLVTFYRFIDVGVSTTALLIIYPIFAFVAAIFSKLMSENTIVLSKNDLKQSLAFTILFFVANLLVFVIPRAM